MKSEVRRKRAGLPKKASSLNRSDHLSRLAKRNFSWQLKRRGIVALLTCQFHPIHMLISMMTITRWSDTVCIDKKNHKEHSENIASMGDFYKNAHICLIVSVIS